MDHNNIYHEKLEGILAHINDAYAPNTIRAYRADFSEWISFCMKKGTCPLLADPFIVAEFLLALADLRNVNKTKDMNTPTEVRIGGSENRDQQDLRLLCISNSNARQT